MVIRTILFPSSYFKPQLVDEDLQEEYDAAMASGLFHSIIFGYDAWFNRQRLILNSHPQEMITAVYRGWMMTPEMYRRFYEELLEQNIRLITSPEMYEAMHAFPHVYPYVKEDTPAMKVFPLHSPIDVEGLKETFNRFLIKDYVKSVKGSSFPAFFDQTITQGAFDHWMEIFYQYRGDLLTGGICAKEYVDLAKYEGHTNEWRVFYTDGQVMTISPNSGQSQGVPSPPTVLIEKYKGLKSVFYTIDYCELIDGRWLVMEAGDGSVSGIPEEQDYREFYERLFSTLKYD